MHWIQDVSNRSSYSSSIMSPAIPKSSSPFVPFVPFPKPASPNSSSTSSWAYSGSSYPIHPSSRSGSLSSSDFQLFPDQPSTAASDREVTLGLPDEKRVRQFGEGWMSSNHLAVPLAPPPSTPLMTINNIDDTEMDVITPQGPTRTRSPSMPILPSQTQHFGLPPTSFPPFTSTDYPDEAYRQFQASGRGGDPEWDIMQALNHFHLPTTNLSPSIISSSQDPFINTGPIQPRPSLLHHHQSVPNLERASQRLKGSVRFLDTSPGGGGGSIDGESAGSLRASTRSIPSMEGVGTRKNVFIYSLPAHISAEELKAFATRYGPVTSVRVSGDEPRLMDRSESKRHAFVIFDLPAQASNFLGAMKAKGYMCELAKTEYKAREDPTSSNVYVVGLPVNWSHEEVEDFMTQFGRVASLRLLTDRDGNRRGPILVRRPQADRAIEQVTGERMQARIADSDNQKGFKKLRNSTSQDVLPDTTRRGLDSSNASVSPGLEYLLHVRSKCEDRLAQLDTEIAQFRRGSAPTLDLSGTSMHQVGYRGDSASHSPMHAAPIQPRWRQMLDTDVSIPSAWTTDLTQPHTSAAAGSYRASEALLTPTRPSFPAGSGNGKMYSPYYKSAYHSFDSNDATQYGSVTPDTSRPRTFPYYTPDDQAGGLGSGEITVNLGNSGRLHQVRSTPDLGQADTNPAKLLWGNK